jgi:hypothetical protein
MRLRLLLILTFLLSNAYPLFAEIVVRIANYPEKTLIYSPFYVFGEIENTGP